MSDGTQYFQKICLNGHQITTCFEMDDSSDNSEYCQECGKKVISACPNCSKPILGAYISDFILDFDFSCAIPKYCRYCSNPYPWTELVINTTKEILSLEDGINESDKTLINDSIPDLLVDTPKTNLAIVKFKKGFASTSAIVKESLRELLVDIISETAKKAIFPD
ncbi:DUF2321 domain-containing protein [Lactococcus lactis]|uniref:DUF2321 domain-containing protein n=1 Tax=Lactococcus lactis TaxID=1358 RepID=UPI0019115888|nr:DUF2321 domain-containing protein [Lactococcus lactis]WDA69233.1 DUF2321 domain-containing protein [Lactococcus lactis]